MDEMKPPFRDHKGRFLPGNSGLPGRPKGCRNNLADAMIDDLYQDWKEHGIQAIRDARESRPVEYLRIVAMIVSKCTDIGSVDDMRYAAVEQVIEERRLQALATIEKNAGIPMISREEYVRRVGRRPPMPSAVRRPTGCGRLRKTSAIFWASYERYRF